MKQIQLKLAKSEIIYDVYNRTHIAAKSRTTSDNPAYTASMQANDEESSLNQIVRCFDNALARVRAVMSPYSPVIITERESGETEQPNTEINNLLSNVSDNILTIELSMPDNFNHDFTHDVVANTHAYIVDAVMHEWYMLTSPNDAAIYKLRADNDLSGLKSALNARIKPVTSKLCAF